MMNSLSSILIAKQSPTHLETDSEIRSSFIFTEYNSKRVQYFFRLGT